MNNSIGSKFKIMLQPTLYHLLSINQLLQLFQRIFFIIVILILLLVCTFRRIRLFTFYLFFERRLIPTLFVILNVKVTSYVTQIELTSMKMDDRNINNASDILRTKYRKREFITWVLHLTWIEEWLACFHRKLQVRYQEYRSRQQFSF